MSGRHAAPASVSITVAAAGADGPRYDPRPKRKRKVGVAQFSIQAFVGPNGSGKSLAAVEMAVIPAWEMGRLVVSNMTLYPEVLGFDAGLYQRLGGWRDIVKMGRCLEPEPCLPGECPHTVTAGRGCVLVLDEASAVLPSRASASAPAQLIRVLNQLRKRDVTLVWTAPAYQRMDIAVRETTQAVTVCTGTFPDRWPRDVSPGDRRWFPRRLHVEGEEAIKIERGWAPNRLFTWVTYEAMSYDEFTLGKSAKLRPRARRSYWRTRHQGMHAYRTLEGVEMLDHVDASGACMDCGLAKKRSTCSCGDGEHPAPGGRAKPAGGAGGHGGADPVNRSGVRRLSAGAR